MEDRCICGDNFIQCIKIIFCEYNASLTVGKLLSLFLKLAFSVQLSTNDGDVQLVIFFIQLQINSMSTYLTMVLTSMPVSCFLCMLCVCCVYAVCMLCMILYV